MLLSAFADVRARHFTLSYVERAVPFLGITTPTCTEHPPGKK
jgi:hypothetical protein